MGMGNAEKIQNFIRGSKLTDETVDGVMKELKEYLADIRGSEVVKITSYGEAINIVRDLTQYFIDKNILHHEDAERAKYSVICTGAVLTIIFAMQTIDSIDHSSLDTEKLQHWTLGEAKHLVNGSIWGFYHDRDIQHAVTDVIGDLYDVPQVLL